MSLAVDLAWLRRSSTLRLALILSAIFALCMAAAVSIAIAVGSDVFERRIDTTLEALAGAYAIEGARGDGLGVILRRPDDLADLPRDFRRVVERGGGTVDLSRDFRQSGVWRVLVATDNTGTPVMAAVPLEDGEEALELLGGVLWTAMHVMLVLTLAVGLTTGIIAQRRSKKINGTLAALAAGDLGARTGISRARTTSTTWRVRSI